MKKTTSLASVARIARGIVAPGSFTSPAVMPMSSVPEKAKFTARIVVNTAPRPLGKRPSPVRFDSSGAEPPAPPEPPSPELPAPPPS